MADPLPYLHLLAPLVQLLPIISLARPPSEPIPEPPGIRPVTIRRITPRRGLILTTLILLALTSCFDGALLVADLLSASNRDGVLVLAHGRLGVESWVAYAVGGIVVWSFTAIVAEWRAKWGSRALVVLPTLGLIIEVPNLVFLVAELRHHVGSWRILCILSLVPPILRLLHYPLLVFAVSTPRVTYEPADESTSLLQDGPEASSSARGREAYGTFQGDQPSTSTSRDGSAVPQTGTGTPKGGVAGGKVAPIVIPKQLGEVKKEEKALDWREVWSRMKKLGPHLWPSTSRRLQVHVAICALILLAGRVLQPALPLALGRVIRALTQSRGRGKGSQGSPWVPFAEYFAIRIAVTGGGLLSFIRDRLWISVSQYTDREMMMVCFNHLLDLSLAYHTKRNTGEVLKVIDRGSAINNLFQTVLFTALPTVLDIFIAFGFFYYLYGPILAGMSLVIMGLYLLVAVTFTQRRADIRRQLTERDVKQRGIISDVLTNWESVKYFTAEHRETTRFRDAIISYQEAETKWMINYQLVYLIQAFLLTMGLLCGSILIAYRVLIGIADAAEFVVFLQYFQQLAGPLDRLGMLYRQLNQNSLDAEKMFNLLAQATEVNDKPGAKDLVVTDGVVEFDNVRFSYDGKGEALKGVSFKIDKGQSMALVGESGSGKSTVLRLLYRFYDVDSGVIRIDGQDISMVTQKSLRKAIGIVPQDSVLWNDTIGANISYGKEGATDEEIITAAVAAKLHDRILGFNEGYSTVVGERGIRLSGGEKQRVSLARMFLKSPAILVLDEATSALDTETEREIQRALSDLAKGRTSLSIAHRLSTIINSDQIVVMKDGQVIEQGGYNHLLEVDGAFASMWKKQIFTEAEMVAQAEGTPNLMDAADDQAAEDNSRRSGSGSGTGDGDQAEASTSAATDVKAVEARPEDIASSTAEAQVEAPAKADVQSGSRGFEVDPEEQHPSTYAEAVKVPSESTDAPISSEGTTTSFPTRASRAPHHDPPAEVSTAPAPADTSAPQATSGATPVRPVATPEKRLSFPPMPRMPTSDSAASGLSDLASGASSPRGSADPNASTALDATPDDSKSDKRRKRLSSIKGFVRRISDQGITRSPSYQGKAKSPMGELDEATALAGSASTGTGTTASPDASRHASGSVAGSGGKDVKVDKRKKRLSLKSKP